MYRTYDEERRSELIDKTLKTLAELTALMLKARTEDDLAERIQPTSASLLNGRVFLLDCQVPRIEDLRFKIDEVHELLESFEVELKTVNDRIRERTIENARRAEEKDPTEYSYYMRGISKQFFEDKK